jgi:CheY-like chemotaxis protein/anti-sigma regulatory factor (Ser/Thr protein kinase)
MADPIRLTQVILNVLSNAAKYTDPGGRIRLGAHAEGDQLVLQVQDNGVGLTRDAQADVFEMFSQVTSSLDRAEGGLGIGLALSKGIVELHGGTMTVHSEGPGHGSLFEIRLPLQATGRTNDAPSVTRDGAAISQRRKVLLADDNEDALETLHMLLESIGHEVITARSGAEALAAAAKVQPEIAVLDIGMPGMNGYEAAKALRREPWGKRMLLVALTGWGQAEDQARARDAGFDHHFTKPVDFGRLEALLGGEK